MTPSNNQSVKKFTHDDIVLIANQHSLEPLLLEAFVEVYAPGSGFLEDGRPKVIFQHHIFWKNLLPAYRTRFKRRKFKMLAVMHRDILHPVPATSVSVSYLSEHNKLDKATGIDSDAALRSALWGRFMLPGEAFISAGFLTIGDFVAAHQKNETEQLSAFMNSLASITFKGKNLIGHLQDQNLQQFAEGLPVYGNENRLDIDLLKSAFDELTEKNKPQDDPEPQPFQTKLIRTSYGQTQTLGEMTILKNGREIFSCKTLELPWKANERMESCIPEGSYHVVKRFSERYKNHFYLTNVPGRSMILIHIGNYFTQTAGCILVGTALSDINADGHPDVVQSGVAMNKLNEILPDEFEILVGSKA
jgi:hypothetical protein